MRLLIDTLYALLLGGGAVAVSDRERAVLTSGRHSLWVSAASIWEIALKWRARHASGDRKGPMGPDVALSVLEKTPLKWLHITPAHAAAELAIACPNKDPFDELLLAQAQVEGLRLFTRDRKLVRHPFCVSAADVPA